MSHLPCGTGFFDRWENYTHEVDMASFEHAAATSLQTASYPAPVLLSAQACRNKNPECPFGFHRFAAHFVACTE